VDEDGLGPVDGSAMVEGPKVEEDWWVALGSSPQRLSWWIRPCSSSVASSLLD
jgi:hypothetical protein